MSKKKNTQKKTTKKSYTLREVFKSLSDIQAALLNDEIAKDICEESDQPISILSAVPIMFEEMDVTAKTVNGKIMLNPALMDEPFNILMRYVIHELVHVMQHIEGGSKKGNKEKGNYLDKKNEEDAFKRQIEFDFEHRPEGDIEEYIEGLFEYHEYPEEKREEKEEDLKELVD